MGFIDKAKIRILSGRGGNGAVAWRHEKFVDKGGPAGGDGGNGGDIYIEACESMSTLLDFKYKSVFKAQCGENGGIKNKYGKNGESLTIKVPVGTVIKEAKSEKIIADLTQAEQKVLVAKGGRGGRGNSKFCTPQRRAPQYCEPGEPGIERELVLELKLIADVGLLGMPNAGKSTFISVISAAKPKIADYPFTTLVPNLGVVRKNEGDSYVVADIPGLIEGASTGAGLGHDFLRHVERCRFFLHIVDLTQDNPMENFNKINNELKKYSEELSNRYQIVALNKIDAIDENKKEEILNQFKSVSNDIFLISAVTHENIDKLKLFMDKKVDEIEKPVSIYEVEEDTGAYDNDDSAYEVIKVSKDTYIVNGGKIKRIVDITDEKNRQQVLRLQNILKGMGVFDELRKKGIKDGDTVIIGHLEMEFYDDEY